MTTVVVGLSFLAPVAKLRMAESIVLGGVGRAQALGVQSLEEWFLEFCPA